MDRNVSDAILTLEKHSKLTARLGSQRLPTQTELQVPEQIVRSGIPRDWWATGGEKRIGGAVSYQGRQFRPLKGGGVRILDGTQIRELPGLLQDVDRWKIHVSSEGPLGYGDGGIFVLDKDLHPQRVLYRPVIGGKVPNRVTVDFIRRTFETIGIVVSSDKGSALQVISDDGKLLGEASLGPYISSFSTEDQLIVVGGGYLFSDRQLIWIAPEPKQIWNFGPSLNRTSTERWAERWRYFGVPAVADGKLYVTTLDGHLLIFDLLRIQRTAGRQKAE